MSYVSGRPGNSGRTSASVAPPPSDVTEKSRQGYSTMSSITNVAISNYNFNTKRKIRSEEDYFNEQDEEQEAAERASSGLVYLPAPGSPVLDREAGDDEEEDPLDAYMLDIDQQANEACKNAGKKPSSASKVDKGVRDDIDVEDNEESYYRYMKENPTAGIIQDDSDSEIQYDENGNPIVPAKSKHIDPLPPIDHSEMEYAPFEKNFYTARDDIAALTEQQVAELRSKLDIKVYGPDPPKPVTSFAHFNFEECLIKVIRRLAFTQPTPIQAQAIPILLSGRDMIGIAKTGSGKTAAFVWPMLIHIMDQPELKEGEGPIGLVLSPTRELAVQIYNDTKRFAKVYNIRVVCCYGGGSKWEQSKALSAGAEIVIATPGRMIDMIKLDATNLARVTYLVLDEADKMFNMGFEAQVRSICSHVRPTRQTMMFSATFKRRIENLARDVLVDPIRVVQGDLGVANSDVEQFVHIMKTSKEKWAWLVSHLVEFTSEGSVLIFVTKKLDCEEVANNLRKHDFLLEMLHGDVEQAERNRVIGCFKQRQIQILVASDVAARGLDIPHIRTVINYDIAMDIDTHTHRIGRTGRAGTRGTAHTLILECQREFAGHLVRSLEGVGQPVSEQLLTLALRAAWFRSSRFKQKPAKNIGGAGLGFKERPGLKTSSEGMSRNFAASVYGTDNAIRGPASDRLSAMKMAFKGQYMSTFRAASDTSWQQTTALQETPGEAEGAKRKKKSRWGD